MIAQGALAAPPPGALQRLGLFWALPIVAAAALSAAGAALWSGLTGPGLLVTGAVALTMPIVAGLADGRWRTLGWLLAAGMLVFGTGLSAIWLIGHSPTCQVPENPCEWLGMMGAVLAWAAVGDLAATTVLFSVCRLARR
ncbi:MAG: hypothetical protein H6739_34335 [Alphaproteobacteria bacterium]|nr:hypothetical protein [Alphaproteobacteria bacterium]